MTTTTNFADVIRSELADDPELAASVDDARFDLDIAERIYAVRKQVGLTQKQLAERIDTQQSVIARLESAEYEGHSLQILRRIASAVGARLGIDFFFKPKYVGADQATTDVSSSASVNEWFAYSGDVAVSEVEISVEQ